MASNRDRLLHGLMDLSVMTIRELLSMVVWTLAIECSTLGVLEDSRAFHP